MVARTYTSPEEYRYGFNGQEREAECSDNYAFEFRIHDSRLGRFLSVDPLGKYYPWNSTYSFAENDVIRCIDLEGLEKCLSIYDNIQKGQSKIMFDGSYDQLVKEHPDDFTIGIIDQLVGTNRRNSQELSIYSEKIRQVYTKNWWGTVSTYFIMYEYSHTYYDENGDLVTETGSFEVEVYSQAYGTIWAPATYIILNRVTSSLLTRVVNGASINKGITLVGKALEKGNAQISKLLRWAETKNLGNTAHLVESDYAAAAQITRDFTKKLGNRAIEELKALGYTKDDFLNYQKIYTDAIKNLSSRGKNTMVQEARLESVNKILSLWK